jgi:putative FmdB family regulatory protein
MPIYEYECPHCGIQLELTQSINDPAPTCDHPDSEKSMFRLEMHKKISKTGFSLKGQGWAKDRYGK